MGGWQTVREYELLRLTEASVYLGVGTSFIQRVDIPFRLILSMRVYERTDIDAWAESHLQHPALKEWLERKQRPVPHVPRANTAFLRHMRALQRKETLDAHECGEWLRVSMNSVYKLGFHVPVSRSELRAWFKSVPKLEQKGDAIVYAGTGTLAPVIRSGRRFFLDYAQESEPVEGTKEEEAKPCGAPTADGVDVLDIAVRMEELSEEVKDGSFVVSCGVEDGRIQSVGYYTESK